jgi:hypothetical protein
MAPLCESFRREAGRVWTQMSEARRLGLSLGEETITETCLFNILRKHRTGSIAVIAATKPEEAKHGADWEWWITRSHRGVGFRVQAKRLFPSGHYESLFKPSDKFAQLKKLVSNAAAHGLQPLYCFYNYDCPPGGFNGCANNCHHEYRGPSFFGCTIALPQDVELIGKDSIADLRGALEPWHSLVCLNSKGDLPGSALAQVQRMARARTFGSVRREKISIVPEVPELPQYVQRLVELGRARTDLEPVDASSFGFIFSEVSMRGDVAGVLVVDQRE